MAGTLNRPVPPGRSRGGQARSTSSQSISQRGSTPLATSPLASTVDIISENATTAMQIEQGNHSTNTSNGLGLHVHTDIEPAATYEIALEDVEDAVRNLSRGDLVLALKRAKEQMDILDAKVEAHVERGEALESSLSEYASQLDVLETDKNSLQFALSHREERIDELMQDQERAETELYLKGQVTERLRKQLDESERARAEAERRYEEQTMSSDKERQFYVDTETLLKTQKAKAASSLERAQAANHELIKQNERLQRQLAQQKRIVSNTRTASPLGKGAPVHDGAVNDTHSTRNEARSDEERSSMIDSTDTSDATLYRAKTLADEQSGTEVESLRNELLTLQTSHSSLTATMQQLQAELRDVKSVNVDLRTQNETFVDLLQEKTINGDLVTGSMMLSRKYSTIGRDSEASSETEGTTTTETSDADDDDVPDVPKSKARSSKRGGATQRHQMLMKQASRQMLNAPRNLASELEKSEPDENAREARKRERTRERSEALGTNLEELHKEIWELRDANQALTLYVTKILDRIIAREGYENVLAVDADQKRTLRSKPSTRLRDRPEASPSSSPERTAVRSPTTGRVGFLGLGRAAPSPNAKSPTTPTAANASITALQNSAAASNKRSSIDWRSFLPSVGGGAASAASPEVSSKPMGTDARRILSSEEVEDKHDEEVREQIRKNLLEQGIVLPENQLKPQKRASMSLGTFFSRVMGASDPGTANKSAGAGSLTTNAVDVTISDVDSSSRASDDGRTSPSLTRREMRQRALEMGGGTSGNLTEAPTKRSLVDEMRARRTGSTSSRASAHSRSTSEAGDASQSPSASPVNIVLKSMPECDEKEDDDLSGGNGGSWRNVMRRMSIVGGSSSSLTKSQPSSPDLAKK